LFDLRFEKFFYSYFDFHFEAHALKKTKKVGLKTVEVSLKSFSATVTFSSIKDSQAAVLAYDKKEGIFGNQLVELKPDDAVQVWFGQPMYEALKGCVEALIAAKSPFCMVRIKASSDGQSTLVKLHSSRSDPADVVPTKRALDELIKGESFFVDERDAQKLNDRRLFKALEAKHKGMLFIAASSAKNRRIVVRGSPEAREEAMRSLIALGSAGGTPSKRKVQLPAGGVKVLLGPAGDGLEQLKERFKVNISLDVRHQTLAFEANDALYGAVSDHVATLKKKGGGSSSSEAQECLVCLDPITDPFTMALCGHFLCRGCVKMSVLSRINSTSYPIVCDCCGHPLAMKDIFALVDEKDKARLVNTAVNSYISSHSDAAVKPCMHPGCAGFTRSIPNDPRVSCSLCSNAFCSSCEVPFHEGKSCAQFKEVRSGEADFKRFLEENKNQMRPCPRCKAFVEKNKGCNHITCHCGAHFCWLCGQGFEDASKTYAHLNSAHGGIYTLEDLLY